jgi:hypothetical protein
MDTMVFQGRTYRLGDDPRYEPLPLPAWFPPGTSTAWHELALPLPSGWGTEPEYHRAYAKYGRIVVLASCARQLDGKAWLHISVSQRGSTI